METADMTRLLPRSLKSPTTETQQRSNYSTEIRAELNWRTLAKKRRRRRRLRDVRRWSEAEERCSGRDEERDRERERERDGEASGWSSGRRLSTWAQFHRLFESFYTCEGAAVVHPPPR